MNWKFWKWKIFITAALPDLLDSLSAPIFLLLLGEINIEKAISLVDTEILGKGVNIVKYHKNKNIQITLTINENLYFRFKTLCKAEKKMPATVLKEFIKNYLEEKEIENDGN